MKQFVLYKNFTILITAVIQNSRKAKLTKEEHHYKAKTCFDRYFSKLHLTYLGSFGKSSTCKCSVLSMHVSIF